MLIIEQTKGRSLTHWSQINWTGVERNLKRLQGRIFRAVEVWIGQCQYGTIEAAQGAISL